MKKLLVFLVLLFSMPAYAHMVELCIPGSGGCRLAIFSEGRFSVISAEGTSTHQQDAIASKQLAAKSIYFDFGTVSVARYNQLKVQNKAISVTKTREEIVSDLNISRAEIRDLLSCTGASVFCAFSPASLVLGKFSGIPVMLAACTGAILTCDQALESLDKYYAKVNTKIQLSYGLS